MKNLLKTILILAGFSASVFGQNTPAGLNATTSTTLSAAVTQTQTAQVCLTSATNVLTPGLANNRVGSFLVVDREAMQVLNAGTSSTCFQVRRGVLGSQQAAHNTTSAVWVGQAATGTGDNSRPFSGGAITGPTAPSGSCIASAQYSLPVIVVAGPAYAGNGAWYCENGVWAMGVPQTFSGSPYTAWATLPFLAPGTTQATDTVFVAGTIYFDQLYVGSTSTLTGACWENGSTVGTTKIIAALYDNTGVLLANTATAGTTSSGSKAYQCAAFAATVTVVGPQSYFIALQGDGAVASFYTYAAGQAPTNYGTGSQTGTFGTLAAITPTVTFTATKGPLMSVY